MLKKLTALLCALLMVFAVAAADSGLPTPDSSVTRESFYGTWNEDKEYWHDHWEPAAVSGGGVCIDEDKIYFLMDSVAYESVPYDYENGRLLYIGDEYNIQCYFGTDGTLYLYESNHDYLVSFYKDRYPGEIIFKDNPFVGEWTGTIVILLDEIVLLPSDLGLELGMIITETEARVTSAGAVISNIPYDIINGRGVLRDNTTVMFFDEYGLLHVDDSKMDLICVPAERKLPF